MFVVHRQDYSIRGRHRQISSTSSFCYDHRLVSCLVTTTSFVLKTTIAFKSLFNLDSKYQSSLSVKDKKKVLRGKNEPIKQN